MSKRILILTGPVQCGKTRLLGEIVSRLKKLNFPLDGYLSQAVFRDEEHIGYDLRDLKMEILTPFLRTEGKEGWRGVGQFFFLPGALEKAGEILLRGADSSLLVVDEVGPLELAEEGVWPALKAVLDRSSGKCLLTIRQSILGYFIRAFQSSEIMVFEAQKPETLQKLIEAVLKD